MKQKPQTELEIELANELDFHNHVNSWFAHDFKGQQAIGQGYCSLSLSDLKEINANVQNIIDEIQNKDPVMAERIRDEIAVRLLRVYNQTQIVYSATRASTDLGNLLGLKMNLKENLEHGSESFFYNDKLREIIQAYQHKFTGRGLNLRFFSRTDEDTMIFMHPSIFSSSVANLITNASKYGVKNTTIDFVSHQKKGNLVLECENHIGREITNDELIYIQGKGNKIDLGEFKSEGSKAQIKELNQGLGIYLVKKVISEGYGGKVKLKSSKHRIINPESLQDYNIDRFPEGDLTYKGNGHPHFYAAIYLPLANLREKTEDMESKDGGIESFW